MDSLNSILSVIPSEWVVFITILFLVYRVVMAWLATRVTKKTIQDTDESKLPHDKPQEAETDGDGPLG